MPSPSNVTGEFLWQALLLGLTASRERITGEGDAIVLGGVRVMAPANDLSDGRIHSSNPGLQEQLDSLPPTPAPFPRKVD